MGREAGWSRKPMRSISAFRNATSRARTVPMAVVSARTFAGDWFREPGARDPASRTVSGSSVLAGQPPMPHFGTPQRRNRPPHVSSQQRRWRGMTLREHQIQSSASRSMLRIGREDVDNASGPASLILTEYGRRVGGLGPGLTCESADALSGCPANDSSAGSQVFMAPTGGAVPICPSCARGRGSQVRRPAGACHPSTSEKGWL